MFGLFLSNLINIFEVGHIGSHRCAKGRVQKEGLISDHFFNRDFGRAPVP